MSNSPASPWQRVQDMVRSLATEGLGSEANLKPTPDASLGDLAIPCFGQGSKDPAAAAEDLAAALGKVSHQSIASVAAAGPYVNVSLDRPQLANDVVAAASDPAFGRSDALESSNVVLEFSSPNTNKPQHLGHVRNNVLGETIASILRACGAEATKTSIINDRGIHICKSMLAYQRWGDGQTPQTTGTKGDHFVGQWYVRFETELKKERDEWYKARGVDRSTLPDRDKRGYEDEFLAQSPLQQAAQGLLKAWEANDPEVRALWERMNSWVYAGFSQTYADFGVTFDKTYFESSGSEAGKQKIMDAVEAGVLARNPDGSIVAKLEPHKLPDKVVLRADGTTLYVSNDINLAFQRLIDFPGLTDLAYVVASEQDLYFRQLFAILKILGFPAAGHLHHVSYGLVNLPEGRMKSREGTVVDADDLLAEVTTLVRDGMAQREDVGTMHASSNSDEVARRAKMIALAAIKVLFLKVHRSSDLTFNPREAIELAGRTGVNLLYTFARASSVLSKAGQWKAGTYSGNVSDSEWAAIKLLAQYPDAVADAARQYEPALLVNHLLDLAAAFNTFYQDQPILKADEPQRNARLALVQSFKATMRSGLELLGIEPLEEM